MMVGGHDSFVNGVNEQAVQLCLRYLQALWPQAVVEDFSEDLFGMELFIYETPGVKEQIDREGVSNELRDRVVNLIHREGQLTVVYGEGFSGNAEEMVGNMRTNWPVVLV